MKKLCLFLVMLSVTCLSYAALVPVEEAQKLALGFYRHYAKDISGTPAVSRTDLTTYQDTPTFYTFTFTTGGFVIMAADDASIPVLGYSFDSPMPEQIANPATQEWLQSYSHEIWQIVQHRLDNSETVKEWNALRRGEYKGPMRDVAPLLNTTWDQGCYYNATLPGRPGRLVDLRTCLYRLRGHRHGSDHEIPRLPAAGGGNAHVSLHRIRHADRGFREYHLRLGLDAEQRGRTQHGRSHPDVSCGRVGEHDVFHERLPVPSVRTWWAPC